MKQTITLKKVYRELWQKKRGSATSQFTGHTVDHYIDGVPVQKKEYVARVAEIAGEESVFRLLTSPTVFPALPWQKQRALLLEVCGNMKDADIIAADSKLTALSEILGKRSIEDHRKVIAAKKSEINKELQSIPVRIDEVRRGLPDVTELDRKAIIKDAGVLETALNDAKLRLQGVDSGGRIAELSKKLAGINADLRKAEDTYNAENRNVAHRINQETAQIESSIRTGRARLAEIDSTINSARKREEDIEKELVVLREKFIAVGAETFQDTTAQACAACGQDLPAEKVQEAREKALAAHNLNKADRLNDIDRKGQTLKEEKEQAYGRATRVNEEKEVILRDMPEQERKLKTFQDELAAIRKVSDDYSLIPGHQELLAEKIATEADITAEKAGKEPETDKINAEINSIQSSLKDAKEKADRFVRREAGEKRIGELMTEEKRLAAEYERLESEIYLTEEFIRTKVKLLEGRINGKFEYVRFKLFNVLVNQGLEECCTVTVNGIPFDGGLNSAGRTNAGLDVVRTLQRHYRLHAPCFIDNAESVVELLPLECQMIRLIVSANDPVLRIEQARRVEHATA